MTAGEAKMVRSNSGRKAARNTLGACSVALALVLGIALSVAPGEATAQEKKGPIVLIAGDLSDPFFGVIKRGADDAAQDLGVEYTYLSLNDISDACSMPPSVGGGIASLRGGALLRQVGWRGAFSMAKRLIERKGQRAIVSLRQDTFEPISV
jgi:hypothetical protein